MKSLSLLFYLGISIPSFAQMTDRLDLIQGFGLVTENDVFAPFFNNDDNYTGQFKLELYVKNICDKGFPFPFIRNHDEPENNNRSFYFNGQGYTPPRKYFDSTSLVTTGRPYASVLNYGFQRTSWWDNLFKTPRLKFRLTTDFSIGKMGSSVPGKVQNFIHEYITVGSRPVKGWHNQIAAPGRFVFTYRAYGALFWQWSKVDKTSGDYSAKNWARDWNLGLTYDLTTGLCMNYFNIGITFNNLQISTSNGVTHHSVASKIYGVNHLNLTPSFTVLTPKEKNKLFVEINPTLKIVGHNSTLSGHPIEDNSPYTIPGENVRRMVPECGLKLIWQRYNERDQRIFQLTYGITIRGQEFRGGDQFHFFGTIGIQTFKSDVF